jgi:glycerol 3-phosphatase-2
MQCRTNLAMAMQCRANSVPGADLFRSEMTLRGSTVALSMAYDVAMLDLDGVIYIGPLSVPGAPEALARAREDGMRLAFVTNNAARTATSVATHLASLGVPAAATDVITSAQVAAHYLGDRLPPGSDVLVVGTTGLIEALRERGLKPVDRADGDIRAVVQGYSPELNYAMLSEAAVAIQRGVPWIATNLDTTVPSARGPLPGNGSLVAALRTATGIEPIATGKPAPTMHRETVERTAAHRPLVVGDRLDTDIEGATAVGVDSLLVFSGVTTPAELLAAPARHQPTYLGRDVGALVTAHPEIVDSAGDVTCNSWRVGPDLTLIRLTSAPQVAPGHVSQIPPQPDADGILDDDLDALRALCHVAWLRPEHSRVPRADDEPARQTLHRLGLS